MVLAITSEPNVSSGNLYHRELYSDYQNVSRSIWNAYEWGQHPLCRRASCCDDEMACNYDASANLNDGSCDYGCNGWVNPTVRVPAKDRMPHSTTVNPIHWLKSAAMLFQTNLASTTYANGDAIDLTDGNQEWMDQANAQTGAYRTIYGDDVLRSSSSVVCFTAVMLCRTNGGCVQPVSTCPAKRIGKFSKNL